MSRDDDALGGDLGELTGPFAPLELLTRPKFQRYVQFLAEALGQDVDMAAEGQEEAEDEEGDGVELLHRAAAAGSVLLIGFLVGQGIPVDGRCSRKRLKAATRSQRSLQQTGKDGLRPPAPLHSAHGSPEATAALLQHNATVTATEAHGVMALHLAATKNAQVVQLLLDAKAPLAAKDLNQQTALHFAARAGCCESLAVLLRQWLADESIISQGARVYGGPLDWRDRWHRTPVHWAVLNGHLQALKALLEARASAEPPKVREYRHVRSTTLRHESPLDIAQRLEPQMVAVLLQHGAVAA
ncbi:unnamed protein product [Effrenium voratum]|nr:unnamed protein product [Effrenium voratum]